MSSKRSTPRRAKRLATLVAAAGSLLAGQVHAQTLPPDPTQQAQAGRTASFNIPAQPLVQALTALGQQAGLQVAVSAPVVAGKTSTAVSGVMTAEQALQLLLSGTGVGYRFTSPTVVTVSGGPDAGGIQLDPVQVQAALPPPQADIGTLPAPYAGGQVARGQRTGFLGNRDYMDTPFTATTYTEELIRNDQARTLIDVVANDPSVRANYPQAAYNDSISIRGFAIGTNAMSFNGLFGAGPQLQVGLAGIERVEIFKGPTAFLNGMSPGSSVGGTVNFVAKRAGDVPLTRVTANYISNTQFGGHIDVGRRFGSDNELGIRANAMFTGGDTPTAFVADDFLDLSIGIDWRSPTTRFDLDLGYQRRRLTAPQTGTLVNAGIPIPPAPSAYNNFYQPWTYFLTDTMFGMARIEHDFAPDFTVYAKLGMSRNDQDLKLGANIIDGFGGNSLSIANYFPAWITGLSGEAGVRGRFETGPVRHELSLAASLIFQQNGNLFAGQYAGPSNIYNPVASAPPSMAGVRTDPTRTSDSNLTSFAFADSLFMAQDRIQLILGGRVQRVQVTNYNGVSGAITAAGYDQSAVTPAVGFVVKPLAQFSIYGNYIQALEQGQTAPGIAANASQIFQPYVSKQFEVGTKMDLGNFGATLGFFQITRPSAFINPATTVFAVDGEQTNRGAEFNVFGEPFKGFKPLGGITLMDGRLTSTAGGVNNGRYAPGVPTVQVNLGADYELPFLRGLAVNGRLIYTGGSYLDPANTQWVQPWTRVDLGARYTVERPNNGPITLRANVINVGNANYWNMASDAAWLTQNPPRTFLVSLSADF